MCKLNIFTYTTLSFDLNRMATKGLNDEKTTHAVNAVASYGVWPKLRPSVKWQR
jgi:hypothetical protein